MNNNKNKTSLSGGGGGGTPAPPPPLQGSRGVGIEAFAIDTNNNNDDGGSNEMLERPIPTFEKGQVQPEQYNDVYFAIAFCIQLVGIVAVALLLGFPMLMNNKSNDGSEEGEETASKMSSTSNVGQFIQYISFLFIGCCLFIMTALSIMTKFSHSIVMIAFICSPITFIVAAVLIFILDPNHLNDDAITLLILFWGFMISIVVVSLYYCCFKRYIPFAAATLHTALVAISSNTGLYLISLLISIVLFCWVMIWNTAMYGIQSSADAKGQVTCLSLYPDETDVYNKYDMCDVHPPSGFTIIFMILGLFWTQQVLQNILHTTTAGTIGTWWVTPINEYYSSSRGGERIISKPIKDSFQRTVSYSFGSICFGSLLVAIIQTLESIARAARNNRNSRNGGGALLLCVVQCLLHLLRNIVEYINSWAFVYVGLYGYDYLTSGRKVIQLFQSRPGFTTFIGDRLIFRVLLLFHLCIAIFTGCLAIILTKLMLLNNNTKNQVPIFFSGSTSAASNNAKEEVEATALMISFIMGFIIGGILSSTILFVVESSVRTIMVCFAESPEEFQDYHPELYEKIINGWKQTYPEHGEYLVLLPGGVPTSTADNDVENNNNNNNNHIGSNGNTKFTDNHMVMA